MRILRMYISFNIQNPLTACPWICYAFCMTRQGRRVERFPCPFLFRRCDYEQVHEGRHHPPGQGRRCGVHPHAVYGHLRPAEKRGHHRQPGGEGREQRDHDRRQLHRGLRAHQRIRPVSAARSGHLRHPPLAAPARQGGAADLRRVQPGRHALLRRPPRHAEAHPEEGRRHGLQLQCGPGDGVLPVPDRRAGQAHHHDLRRGGLLRPWPAGPWREHPPRDLHGAGADGL